MNLHLLRVQKPLNRKFPTSSSDMLCDWSPAISFLHLCCIYLSTHKMMRNIMAAGPKCIWALGSLLSNINPPHLHSSFISLVINICYFPSPLCTAWQCSIALGLVAVEPRGAPGGVMPFCTSRLPLTMHQAGISTASHHYVKKFFVSAPQVNQTWLWILISIPVLFLSLSWRDLAAGRCFWRDGGWKLSEISGSSFQKQHCGYWSHPEAGEYPVQHGHTLLPGQLWEHLGLQATQMSLQVRCITMKLCLRLSEGPAGSDFCGTRELLIWVLWSAKWTMSFSKELRVQTRAAISTVPQMPSSKNSQSLGLSAK